MTIDRSSIIGVACGICGLLIAIYLTAKYLRDFDFNGEQFFYGLVLFCLLCVICYELSRIAWSRSRSHLSYKFFSLGYVAILVLILSSSAVSVMDSPSLIVKEGSIAHVTTTQIPIQTPVTPMPTTISTPIVTTTRMTAKMTLIPTTIPIAKHTGVMCGYDTCPTGWSCCGNICYNPAEEKSTICSSGKLVKKVSTWSCSNIKCNTGLRCCDKYGTPICYNPETSNPCY